MSSLRLRAMKCNSLEPSSSLRLRAMESNSLEPLPSLRLRAMKGLEVRLVSGRFEGKIKSV